MFNCAFVTFPFGILGQVWYLTVLIPDLCRLSIQSGAVHLVSVPPEVQLFSNRMSQYKGRETILDCRITANPHGYEVWRRDGREIKNSWKYGVNVYEDDVYTKILSLRIGSIDDEDFGKYNCFASNSFGSDEEDMLLYGKCLFMYSKTCLNRPHKKKTKQWFSRPIIA